MRRALPLPHAPPAETASIAGGQACAHTPRRDRGRGLSIAHSFQARISGGGCPLAPRGCVGPFIAQHYNRHVIQTKAGGYSRQTRAAASPPVSHLLVRCCSMKSWNERCSAAACCALTPAPPAPCCAPAACSSGDVERERERESVCVCVCESVCVCRGIVGQTDSR